MRIFLSLVLAAGAVFGIGGGIARLHHGGRHHREHMMDRVAETCVRAARNVDGRDEHDGRGPMPAMPTPHAAASPAAAGESAPTPRE